MTSSVEINELVQCKYSKIAIDRDGRTVTKKVIDWLEFGVFEREIYWLQRLADIPFIPNLLDFDHNSKTLITEYAGERLTADNLPVDWDHQARTIIRILRKYDCAHNDIKPSELLVNDGKLSLCDFAWATPYGAPIPTNWPPALGEEFAFENHSSLNDCFSLMRSVCWVLETDRKTPANQLSCKQHTESELELGEKKFQFCQTPNMYAGNLDYIENVDTSVVKGYQCYEINAKTIKPLGGNFTSPKSQALLSFFTAENFSNRTVNDLGCANGFFSFSSMFAGAEKTFAIDMDEDLGAETVVAAIEASSTFIDTAPLYGGTISEKIIGRVLQERPDLAAKSIVVTKVGSQRGYQDYTYDVIMRNVEDSQERLGIQKFELLSIHDAMGHPMV